MSARSGAGRPQGFPRTSRRPPQPVRPAPAVVTATSQLAVQAHRRRYRRAFRR